MLALALSVRQPWLDLLLSGRKTIETRTWRTNYRGPLLLHAPARVDRVGVFESLPALGIESPDEIEVEAILGAVDLVDCRPGAPSDSDAACCMVPASGVWAWQVTRPRRCQRFDSRGRLGVYSVDVPESLARILALTDSPETYRVPGSAPISTIHA